MVKWGAMVDYVGWWWSNTRGWSAIDNGVDDFGVEAIVDDGDCVDGGEGGNV